MGDDINTDVMSPGPTMMLDWPERKASMFPDDPEFIAGVTEGDIIIGGSNFGCGSSREQAVHNLLRLGIAAVIAPSFARIFFRNAIANGLPVIQCPDINSTATSGDIIQFDWTSFEVKNISSETNYQAEFFTREMLNIISAGGMIKLLKQKMAAESHN